MDNTFEGAERLYRAVYPPSHPGMFWKKNGKISPSAFADQLHGYLILRRMMDSITIISTMAVQMYGIQISIQRWRMYLRHRKKRVFLQNF